MRKTAVWIGVLLILLGLALVLGALFAVDFDTAVLSGETVTMNAYEINDAFRQIKIDTKATDVCLRLSENRQCSVVCEERDAMKHTVSVADGTLMIVMNDRRDWTDYLTLFSKQRRMTVYLPAEFFESLTLSCGTGDVWIPEGVSFGSAEIMTSTGNIRIDDVSADEMTLTVSTGDIMLKNVSASGTLSITSSTGDVRFDNCDAGTISVKATTGDVTGTLRTDKVFLAKTSTGKVDVPDTTNGGCCEITTSTGDIRISYAP